MAPNSTPNPSVNCVKIQNSKNEPRGNVTYSYRLVNWVSIVSNTSNAGMDVNPPVKSSLQTMSNCVTNNLVHKRSKTV